MNCVRDFLCSHCYNDCRNENRMNRTTDELLKVLKEKDSLDSFLSENANEMVCNDLKKVMEEMLDKYGMSRRDVVTSTHIERSYLYRLMSGDRINPSRDVLLQFGLALKADLDDVQKMLRVACLAMLYPRVKRDAVIIHCLNNKEGVTRCDQVLYDHGEKLLGERE